MPLIGYKMVILYTQKLVSLCGQYKDRQQGSLVSFKCGPSRDSQLSSLFTVSWHGQFEDSQQSSLFC